MLETSKPEMIVIGERCMEIEQGSAEWLQVRCGQVTASQIHHVVSRRKDGKPYAGYDAYFHELLTERLTGLVSDHYVSPAMQWGTDHEDAAALEYEMERGVSVERVGYVPHPTIVGTGSSPDRLVGKDGLLEIKAPNSTTHLKTLLGGPIDEGHWWQMQWQMECLGRGWCDYMSFDPRFRDSSPHLVSHIERVERDDEALALARERVAEFIAHLDDCEARLMERKA